MGDDGPPAFVQMAPQVVPGEDIPQGVGVIIQVFKPALNTGLGAGRVTVPAIDHPAAPDGDGVHQPVLLDAGHQPGEVLRRHLGKYPCKVADGVLHLHIHSPPASRRPAFYTGPRGFTFTPVPVSSLVGWNGLQHPPARTMSHQSVNPIPDLSGQGLPRPETAHPAMPAHRQEYRGAPGSPETRSRGLTAVTGTSRPTGWDRGQAVPHPSRIAIDYMEAGFVESRAGAAVARMPSTSRDLRLGGMGWRESGCAAAAGDSWCPLPVARAASPSPPRTLAMGLKRTVHLTSG